MIVVEVLSPPTQSIDTSDNFADYFRVPSVQHYLVVRVRRHEIIHHSPSGDTNLSRVVNAGTIALDLPGIDIDLAQVYGTEYTEETHR